MTMGQIFTKAFWVRFLENGVHAFAGGVLGIVGTGFTGDLTSVPWETALSAGAIGALVSGLASLASEGVPNTAPASFLPARDELPRG